MIDAIKDVVIAAMLNPLEKRLKQRNITKKIAVSTKIFFLIPIIFKFDIHK